MLTMTLVFGMIYGIRYVCYKQGDTNMPIYKVDTDDKKISLSFDVAWGSSNIDDILEILDKHNVSASSINLEITESAAANSPEMFLNTMSELKDLGFTFSMDDYGTGYSNLSHMYDTDFDIIKLDKSILWNSYKSKKADIILQNTVKMIKEMEHNIVIEGVETEEQANKLTEMGCDYFQGFLYSKPVNGADFLRVLNDI